MNHLKIMQGLGVILFLYFLVSAYNDKPPHKEAEKALLSGVVKSNNTMIYVSSKTLAINVRALILSYSQSNRNAEKGSDTISSPLLTRMYNVLDFRRLGSWLLVLVFVIVLVFVKLNFVFIDNLISGLYRNSKVFINGGSKRNASKSSLKNVLQRLKNITKNHWYPFLSGGIAGAVIFIGTIWDESGTKWFFSRGIINFPLASIHPVCYFLYACCIIGLFITLSWIIGSFSLDGLIGGFFRIILLLLINSMLMMVTYFLLIPVTLFFLGFHIYRIINHEAGFSSSGQ